LIRAANHSSYPLSGGYGPDEALTEALAAGAPAEEIRELRDQLATIIVAEQSRAFIDLVTDGLVYAGGPLGVVREPLTGLEDGPPLPWFESGIEEPRPVCRAPLAGAGPFLLAGYDVVADVAQKPVLVALPGPVTTARLADDRHYGDPDALADALAGVLAEQVAALRARGAACFQLEEPWLCRHPEAFDAVAATAAKVFAAAGDSATTILSATFGTLAGVADRLGELPGTHLGIDATDDDGLALVDRLPAGRGVVLGLFDAGTEETEDAADVAKRLEPFRERLVERDVIVGPSAGLGGLDRDAAFDKLLQARYLVEQLGQDWNWS
jgi:methionine synthase II (cobalamin-independent)